MIALFQYLKNLLRLKPRDVPLRVGLRNTLAVIIPLAIGVLTGNESVGLAVATGAMNTMLADQPGIYRIRMLRLLIISVMGSLSAFVGCLLANHYYLFLAATLIWGTAGGIMVAVSVHAGRAGLTSMILLVVTAGTYRGEDISFFFALGIAMLFFLGGLLQTSFAVAAWPLHRYRPERLMLNHICSNLASYARQDSDNSTAPPLTQTMIALQELLYGQTRVRNATLEIFSVLAEELERIRIELMALNDLYRNLNDPHEKTQIRRILNIAALTMMGCARALIKEAEPEKAEGILGKTDVALKSLKEVASQCHLAENQRRLLIAEDRAVSLCGQLRAAVRYTKYAGSHGALRLAAHEAQLPVELRPTNPIAILKANLNLSSVACRHAIRCGIALTIAVIYEHMTGMPHAYWIPMTTAIVLKPDFSTTISFSVWRFIGTLFGLTVVTLLMSFTFTDSWSRIALMAVLCFSYRIFTTRHYGIGVMLLTSSVVTLFSFYGITAAEVFEERVLYTLFGSLLGLSIYLMWPTWEKTQVRTELSTMLNAYREYIMALMNGDQLVWHKNRTAARAARSNAQASLDRLRAEPDTNRRLIAFSEGILANANRMVRAAMLLEAALQSNPHLPEFSHVERFASQLNNSIMALINGINSGMLPHFPDLRAAERELVKIYDGIPLYKNDQLVYTLLDACDRITNSVDAIAHLQRLWAEKREIKQNVVNIN